MSHEQLPLDLQALWQQQTTQHHEIALADIKHQAQRFQYKIRSRNFLEYAAVVLLMVMATKQAFVAVGLMERLGAVLTVLGAAYVGMQLWWRASALRIHSLASAEAYLAMHQRELARQIAALRGVWHWYLLPLIPGMVVTMLPAILRNPSSGLTRLGFGMVFFVLVYGLNLWGARRLRRELDELNRLQ